MALTHLVDTSVLTRLSRRAVRSALEPLAAAGRVGRSGISDLEIGYSARNAREWDALQGALSAFGLVETDARHLQRARQVQRMLAGRSQHGRKVPDLLVAAAAEDAGLVVLHYDADFDRIAAVTGQKCELAVCIVANECRNARRVKWTSAVRLGLPQLAIHSSEERVLRGVDLRRALIQLGDRDRLVVILFFYLDLPLEEVHDLAIGVQLALQNHARERAS